jgi:serine/threonine protein kinase
VFEYGETHTGIPYIIMELLDGETLGARLKRFRTLPLADVVQLVTQVASALQTAHTSRVVHRDIKPDNIFLSQMGAEFFVKVIDFGIAKAPPSDLSYIRTMTGQILGTPTHMSPDSMFGLKDVDGRADVWGLGAIAYEALTGQRPFQGKSFPEVIVATDKGVFVKPTVLQPMLPEAIDVWTEQALSRVRETRFASVTEAAEAFKGAAINQWRRATTPPPAPATDALVVTSHVPIEIPIQSSPPERADRPAIKGEYQSAPTLVSGRQGAPSPLELARQAAKREGRNEARVEEAARSVLTVLCARGIVVQDAELERILTEKDPARIECWLRKAAVASSVNEVLNEPI